MTAMNLGQCLSRELAWTMRGMHSATAAVQGSFGTDILLPEFSQRMMEGSLQM